MGRLNICRLGELFNIIDFIHIYSLKPMLGRINIKKFRVYPFENLGWLSWLNILDFIHIYSLKPRLVRMDIEKFWVYSFENLGWLSWLN